MPKPLASKYRNLSGGIRLELFSVTALLQTSQYIVPSKIINFRNAKTHNAAHHAPAGPIAFDDIMRVAGRVHALVRLAAGINTPYSASSKTA
jgi:hypothetical protein